VYANKYFSTSVCEGQTGMDIQKYCWRQGQLLFNLGPTPKFTQNACLVDAPEAS